MLAQIFHLVNYLFTEPALKVRIAGAVEDAAACKAPGIDGAFAVFAIRADAGGHRQQRNAVLGQAGLKINQFRQSQKQSVAESLKITALTTGLAGHGSRRQRRFELGIKPPNGIDYHLSLFDRKLRIENRQWYHSHHFF